MSSSRSKYWGFPNGSIRKVKIPGYGFFEGEKVRVVDNQKIKDKRGNYLIKEVESLTRNYSGSIPKKYTK